MIEIDGSIKSGSGTIVRYALSLAAILKKRCRIRNIRAKRTKPGLGHQHLKTLLACCELTEGDAQNAKLGASEIIFTSGKSIKGGEFKWDIGTAGSAAMMSLCLIPLGLFADRDSIYIIRGGLFQDFAPNVFHTKYVLMELLKKVSFQGDIEVIKPGYVPKGGGIIKVYVKPLTGRLKSLRLPEQGKIVEIKGIAISSHLKERRVGQRMAEICNKVLIEAGYKADIEVIEDTTAEQKGAALFIYALTDKGCIIGSDMAGKLGRTSEEIGKTSAQNLLDDIRSGASVDRFTADQLILYAGLAEGESEYVIPFMTGHIDSNIWLIENILGAEVSLKDRRLIIKGAGLEREIAG